MEDNFGVPVFVPTSLRSTHPAIIAVASGASYRYPPGLLSDIAASDGKDPCWNFLGKATTKQTKILYIIGVSSDTDLS